MKKAFIFLLICFACIIVRAQKLQKPIIDKITGDTTWQTSRERLAAKTNFWGSDILFTYAFKTKQRPFLAFSLLNGQGIKIFSINEGNKAIIKMSDGKIISLSAVTSRTSDVDVAFIGNIDTSTSTNLAFYKISVEDLTVLLSGKMSVVRIETSKGNFDYDIKEKNSEVVSKLLSLLNIN